MSSNLRDLKVRFVGDAGSLKQTFNEVSAGAATTGAGLKTVDGSAQSVGTSFTKTGKLFRGVGRSFKASGLDAASAGSAFASTIPALSGVASGAGMAVMALDSLSQVAGGAGPAGLAILAGAALAAAAAYVFLHDDVSAATDAMRGQQKANAEVAASHRATTDAVYAHKEALAALKGASLSQKEATLGLEQANIRVAETLKESGKGSLEYRQALLDQARAQEAVRSGREDAIRQGEAAIEQTHATSKQIADETAESVKNADAARKRALGLKLGLIAGKDAAGAAKEVKAALAAESTALDTASAKHKDNAQRAREMAAATDTSTAAGKRLKARLLELAATELDLSKQEAAVRALGSAVSTVIGLINSAAAAISRLTAMDPTPRGGGGPGKPGKPRKLFEVGPNGKTSDEIMARLRGAPVGSTRLGRGTPLTATDVAGNLIDKRHRGDDTQDKVVRRREDVATAKAGVTNPDEIAARGDKAVALQRKKELKADADDVRHAIKRVNNAIRARRKKLQEHRASRQAAHGKTPEETAAKQAKWTALIEADLAAIQRLFDERRALNRQAAEIKSEAASLGYEIGELTALIESLPDVVPPEPVTTESAPSAPGADDTGVGASGPSPDAQAQIDQANTNAATARRGQLAAEAFSQVLLGSPSIDNGASIINVYSQSLVPSDPSVLAQIASTVVGALGTQGSTPTSAFAAGV
jgi:hypothetical protein